MTLRVNLELEICLCFGMRDLEFIVGGNMDFEFIVAGEKRTSSDLLPVINPYTGEEFARASKAGKSDIEDAIVKMGTQFNKTRVMSSMEKADILKKVAKKLTDNKEEFAKIIAQEAGKPIRNARIEADRAALIFAASAEEAKRIGGEVLPADIEQKGIGKMAVTKRFPIGIILGITPFNFPLHLVAHKMAPAIAAGDPIIIKPASKTPLSALMLGYAVIEAGWDAVSVLPCATSLAEDMVKDDRIKMLTFTGSDVVGWSLKSISGKKKVALELGGNAAVIIHEDADIEKAAVRCTAGAFAYAGQVCISLQRIYAHSKIYDAFKKSFTEKTKKLIIGDPLDDKTDLSCMIDESNLNRLEEWMKEAQDQGGKILCGGKKEGTVFHPTIMEDTPCGCAVVEKEVFGPVAVLEKYDDIDDALKKVNSSRYGLQAGIFTNKMNLILKAFNEIEAGGLMVNDVPTFRIDTMPYGGVKDSGLGREGPRWAIEEMTEIKLMILS